MEGCSAQLMTADTQPHYRSRLQDYSVHALRKGETLGRTAMIHVRCSGCRLVLLVWSWDLRLLAVSQIEQAYTRKVISIGVGVKLSCAESDLTKTVQDATR